MAHDIFDASPKALKLIPVGTERKLDTHVNLRSKYKFDQMQVGQCFVVSFTETEEGSLRVAAYRAGKKAGKKFAVLKHDEHSLYEIARVG